MRNRYFTYFPAALLALLACTCAAQAQNIYQRVTSGEQLVSGNKYIFVCTSAGENSDESVTMAQVEKEGSAGRRDVLPVKRVGDYVELNDENAYTDKKPDVFTLGASGMARTFKKANGYFLTYSGSSTTFKDTNSTRDGNSKWTIVDEGGHCFVGTYAPVGRYIDYYKTEGKIGVYSSNPNNDPSGTYRHVDLYVQTDLSGPLTGFYRLQNGDGKYLCVNANQQLKLTEDVSDWGTIFTVRSTDDGHTLSAQGLNLGAPAVAGTVPLSATEAARITVATPAVGGSTLQLAEGLYLATDAANATQVVASATAATWTFEPVEAITQQLQAAGSGIHFATLYADIPYRVRGTAKAYTVQANFGLGLALPFEVKDDAVNGRTAVLFIGMDAETEATLEPDASLLDAAEPMTGNDLQGSCFPVRAGVGTFAFSEFENAAGFYPCAADLYIPANRAFIRTAEGNGARGLSLGSSPSTGLSTPPATIPSAATGTCYDLQGRRVAQPAHGVYVRDGRRIWVK